MNRSLLMANQNMLKLILIKNCVIDVENGTARISEDVFNTFFGQTLYQYLCACKL